MTNNILPESIEAFGFPVTLAFSNDGRTYVSERMTGRLWQIGQGNNRLIKSFPVVPLIDHHETGLIGITLDPEFEDNNYIYCYYTVGSSDKDFKNRVVRIKEDGSGEELLLDNIPAGMIHNGGIMAFAPDHTLYIGTGVDDPVKQQAQDLSKLNGKILRINRDGSIPSDNPFPNSPVYSYGHRNIFGVAVHPRTGRVYVCDVGPDKNDEINIIEKGGNYGWPTIMGESDNKDFINPIKSYSPVITPVQCVFVGDDLYFGSYNQGTVHKLTLTGTNYDIIEKDEIVYQDKPNSIVGVFHSPDGNFYVTNPSKITRFQPTLEK